MPAVSNAAVPVRKSNGRKRAATVDSGGRSPVKNVYTSVCSAISSASSTSIPRYLTVLSSLV